MTVQGRERGTSVEKEQNELMNCILSSYYESNAGKYNTTA